MRRRPLGIPACVAAFVATVPFPPAAVAAAQTEARRLEPAWERLDAFVERSMRRSNTPGLALAVTDRGGPLRVATYGFADAKARLPVRPDTLFEIGSISKSFTAILLLQLRDEGRFDPQAPVAKFLPWFSVRTKFDAITGHHLLTHTAGLPRDRDDVPSSPFQAAALRDRWTGYAPGARYAYSNVGYQVLGYVVEEIEGIPYPEVLRRRILEPLGMTASEPSITHETRRRLAVGYATLYDDRPAHPSHPLVESTWLEYGAGDGSVAATAADLAAYLRMILHRGKGPGGRILSEESFRLLTERSVPTDPGAQEGPHYGYGLTIRESDGRRIVGHGGGMVGYASSLLGDLDDGLGAVALVNGPGNPGAVAEFALRAVRAALRGEGLPDLPESEDPRRVADAADYGGTYESPGGKRLVLEAEGESLLLLHDGGKVALERRGRDRFFVPHPDFALHLLAFGREEGAVVEASHGSDWYPNERYAGPREFVFPEAWKAYPGHYRCAHAWFNNFRLVLRKGTLLLVAPSGGEQRLVPVEDGLFRVGDEETAERVRFDTLVNGKALRANLSGVDYYRSFTP